MYFISRKSESSSILLNKMSINSKIKIWQILRNAFPDYAPVWSRPVFFALRQGEFDLAAKLAEEALELAPQCVDSWVGWAQIATFQKNWAAAAERWNNVKNIFPHHALGYAREAEAWYALKDLNKARLLCMKSLGLDRNELTALIVFARICLESKKYEQTLKICEHGIAISPQAPEFYLLAVKTLVKQQKYDDAKRYCMEGMAHVPSALGYYIEYARVCAAQKDYTAASDCWLSIRRKFPFHLAGYTNGVELALSQKKWDECGEICKIAFKHHFDCLSGLSVDESVAPNLLAWAKEPLTIYHYQEVLHRLRIFQTLFPNKLEGYVEKAKVFMLQYRPHKAEQTCMLAIGLQEPSIELIEILIDALWMQGKLSQSENFCWQLCYIFPATRNIVEKAIYKLLRQNNWQESIQLYDANEKLFLDDIAAAKLKFAIRMTQEPSKTIDHLGLLAEAYNKIVKIGFPLSADTIFYLNMLAVLAESSVIWKQKHYTAMESLLLPYKSVTLQSHPVKKLCFYGKAYILGYFSAVIRNLPVDEVDILIRESRPEQSFLDATGLHAYHFRNVEKVNEYQYIIADATDCPKTNPGQTLICFRHAADAVGAWNMPGVGAFILPFHSSAVLGAIQLSGDEYKLLTNLDCSQKCEIISTGAYHVSKPECLDKSHLRSEVARIYNISLDADKPLVYVVEGEICNKSQIIYALNKIANYANVIYKPLSLNASEACKISKSVFIIREQRPANNLLRYAADIIMAEYWSGTCASSLMLGLPVIPFYTQLCKNKCAQHSPNKPQSYRSTIPQESQIPYNRYFHWNPKDYILGYLANNNLLVDILDTDTIRKFILSNEYLKLLEEHLPILQQNAFGNYIRDNAPQRTAELILRFVNNRTFGKDCAAIFLKTLP